jgi:hypothetical protein
MIIMITATRPGTIMLRERQLLVVPDARLHGEGQWRPAPFEAHARPVAEDDGAGVGEDDGGGVGVAAVDEGLHRRRLAGSEVAGEAARQGEHHRRLAAVEHGACGGRVAHARHLVEVARRPEGLEQGAARRRAVGVPHCGRDVAHVPADGVAEEQQQQQRQQEGEHHAARSRRSCSTSLRETASRRRTFTRTTSRDARVGGGAPCT